MAMHGGHREGSAMNPSLYGFTASVRREARHLPERTLRPTIPARCKMHPQPCRRAFRGYLRDTGAVLIFGPGEAKGELKKRFEKDKAGAQLVTMETTDKMTEPQIVAHVRHHF